MSKSEVFEIEATVRNPGKGFSRQMRLKERIPAVVYGPQQKGLNISIDERDAVKCSKHGFENTLITLKSPDSMVNGVRVLRKNIVKHPVTRRPVHLDFFAPDMSQAVRVAVEVRFIGKAKGTAEGGLFSSIRRDIEIECLPTDIPEFFELDVSDLGVNQSMHVSDIKIPERFKLITATSDTLCNCAELREEVIEAPVAAAGAAAPGAAPAAGAAAAGGADKDKDKAKDKK